jgi:hypothetical protein
VQVANGWSWGTSEVLVIGLHIVGRFEYEFVIKALGNLWSKKNRGASLLLLLLLLLLLFTFILFPSYFLFFSFFFFFSYFSFLLIIIFFIFHSFFCSSELFQHNTYIEFVGDDVMTPPPYLNDVRPRALKRGKWLLK